MTPLRYREVSLDSDPLAEEDAESQEFRRLMVELPKQAHERSMFVRTTNGNLVPRQAR